MDREQLADRVTAELASRVAKRSTLSSSATPFTPSFLRPSLAVTEAQTQQPLDGMLSGKENMPVGDQRVVLSDDVQYFHDEARNCNEDPSFFPIAATVAVASTALSTFGNMTEEELQQLEEYLLDPNNGGDEDATGDDRLFVNDDNGMGPEEEAWLIQQMIETEAAIHKQ